MRKFWYLIQIHTTNKGCIYETRLNAKTKEEAIQEANKIYGHMSAYDRQKMSSCFICKAYPDDEINERFPNWGTMTNIFYYKKEM